MSAALDAVRRLREDYADAWPTDPTYASEYAKGEFYRRFSAALPALLDLAEAAIDLNDAMLNSWELAFDEQKADIEAARVDVESALARLAEGKAKGWLR